MGYISMEKLEVAIRLQSTNYILQISGICKCIEKLDPIMWIFFMIVIDNLRYDQWQVIRPILMERFTPKEESLYYSILPTATQYARNSIFAGMLPSEIQKNPASEGGRKILRIDPPFKIGVLAN